MLLEGHRSFIPEISKKKIALVAATTAVAAGGIFGALKFKALADEKDMLQAQNHRLIGVNKCLQTDFVADNNIDIKDSSLLRNAIAEGTNNKRFDLNKDGIVDEKDNDILKSVFATSCN